MIVQKFGGTSVGNADSIRQTAKIISSDDNSKIVVLSAMSGVTDMLYYVVEAYKNSNIAEAAQIFTFVKEKFLKTTADLIKEKIILRETENFIVRKFEEVENEIIELDNETIEYTIVALGEICTSYIVHKYLISVGIDNEYIYAPDFLVTNFSGKPEMQLSRIILKKMLSNLSSEIVITQGFICGNLKGNLYNLGRGGSDYSATTIGALIDAEEVQIWSDKNGILNNDPRIVENTRTVEQLSYTEAEELAYFGAKILHPKSIKPARDNNIRIIVKNTFNPQAEATIVSNDIQSRGIKAVASKDNVVIVRVRAGEMLNAYGFLSKIFRIFEKYKTSVDVITTSEVSVSMTVEYNEYLQNIKNDLEEIGDVEIEEKQTVVCIVGDFAYDKNGIAAEVFNALDEVPIKMISQGSTNQNITLVFSSNYREFVHNLLNEKILKNSLECVE